MATRSTISILNLDGTVNSIYCHWDGYIDGIGLTLLKHYNTRESINKLIAGGEISSLGSYVSDKMESFDPDKGEEYTVFYSYRGESKSAKTYSSIEEFEKNFGRQDFNYIFIDGVWSVDRDNDWEDLEFVIGGNNE